MEVPPLTDNPPATRSPLTILQAFVQDPIAAAPSLPKPLWAVIHRFGGGPWYLSPFTSGYCAGCILSLQTYMTPVQSVIYRLCLSVLAVWGIGMPFPSLYRLLAELGNNLTSGWLAGG